jgi:two-component system sensor histidine kinase UhpB
MASRSPAFVRSGTQPSDGTAVILTRLLRALLRFPLFHKILVANAAIVVLCAVGGTLLGARLAASGADLSIAQLALLSAAVGGAFSVAANLVILRLALSPLRSLEETAEAVRRGDFDVRAPFSPLADAHLERLTGVLNSVLDSVAEYRRRLQNVAARALRAEEEERKRIARELHDDTMQRLSALVLRLRSAGPTLGAEGGEELARQIRHEITEVAAGVRRIAQGLRPPPLDELGVGAAIEAHVRSLRRDDGPEVAVDSEPLAGLLTPDQELALYRILQEATSNVVRHAGADGVVRIYREGDRVVATVEDRGAGFDVEAAMAGTTRGLGLSGMEERAAYVGGRVLIRSRPGAGTTVRVEIPIVDARASNGATGSGRSPTTRRSGARRPRPRGGALG